MNEQLVTLAGATGDLGGRIAKEVLKRGGRVRALVREAGGEKAARLKAIGVEVVQADFDDAAALAKACEGSSIVVSTLAGLRDVIVDTQSKLLQAAVRAGVPRFMPSDFAIDFTKIPDGWNRNLNLRNEFRERLEAASIRPTSILNGAFTDMLTGVAPFILFRVRRILCWGDPDQLMDWTTMADTAAYAASAALDPSTPRFLKIAADQLSARSMAAMMTELTGQRYKVLRPGGPRLLRFLIHVTKATTPKSNDIYPPWQGMQYMHNMYAGFVKFDRLDNDRYPIRWTRAREVLAAHLAERGAGN